MALTPRNIREHLGLNRPIYAPTSAYGHFGRTAGEAGEGTFSWEAVDLAESSPPRSEAAASGDWRS